ncbi:hypothetical protein INT47_001727 [Mucor saturninus]|uniref:Protein Zds1 C-terminal domain-containing protein n=1 Tax=Mucor saturninus TaxID=64648 RepID=A0A8H7RJP0_9FUNG|nr:hypothetical protein INT47_001727 [Mucor saturninus]
MTTSIQQTQLTLPEIDLSDDWDDLNFLPQTQPSPPPHQSEQTDNTDSITTGLTRALSLPRQINKTWTQQKEDDSIRKEVINISTSNPSHLFWVPASQHPEIAPAEFEKYVDTHGLTIRKKSIKRRQSVLSVYFTANDQQKLMEELAKTDTERDRRATLDVLEDTDNEDRKQKLVLRRSVSLQLPSAGDYYIRNVPDLLVFDRNSSPLDESRALVPKGDRPLLRRGARTNFKRNSSVTAPNRPSLVNRKSESDCTAEQQPIEPQTMVRSASADEGITLADHENVVEEEPLSPVVEEVRDLCIATRESEAPPKPIVMSRSASTSTATSASSRKSSWSWAFWSDEKSSKKNKIDPVEEQLYIEQELEQEHRQPQISKSSDAASISSSATERGKRFTLSSLFSRKSKHANSANMDAIIAGSTITNEAPKDFQLNRMNMTRLPLHVERAIYKLSHVKLANPRRPLHEQVLISNQMFWYLSIIATNPPDNHHHPSSSHHQPQQKKKKPRKLVKKQRPPQPRRESSSKLNHTIVGGATFLANKSARDTSTGFVVPENYLNPKHQKKKPTKTDYDPKQSDSSSDDDDDDDPEEDDDDDDEDGQQDDVPLALYKSTSRRAK